MLDPARLVFIDETAASTNMVRLRGRCLRGERLVASVPHGHWKTITFVAGLRHDGIIAPFVLDGAMNGPTFLAYIEQCLVPALGRRDIVVMDKLPAHKVAGVVEFANRKCNQIKDLATILSRICIQIWDIAECGKFRRVRKIKDLTTTVASESASQGRSPRSLLGCVHRVHRVGTRTLSRRVGHREYGHAEGSANMPATCEATNGLTKSSQNPNATAVASDVWALNSILERAALRNAAGNDPPGENRHFRPPPPKFALNPVSRQATRNKPSALSIRELSRRIDCVSSGAASSVIHSSKQV